VVVESLTSQISACFLAYVAEPAFRLGIVTLFCVVGAERDQEDELLPERDPEDELLPCG